VKSICRVRLTRRDATHSSRYLTRTDILQVFALRQDSLNLQLMRQSCFQVAIGGELIVADLGPRLISFNGLYFLDVPARRFVAGALFASCAEPKSTRKNTTRRCKKDRVTLIGASPRAGGCNRSLDFRQALREGWELGKSRSAACRRRRTFW